MSNKEQHLYEFGPFQLNTAERQLLRDGQKISLTPKAFDTLVALIERRGHLVEKEELMSALWPDSFVAEGNLTNNVSVLRKALGDGEDGCAYIETVPKVGYRFIAPSRELPLELLVVQKRTLTRVVTEEEEELSEEVAPAEIGSERGDPSRLELASGPFAAKHVAVERIETGLTPKARQGRRAATQWVLLGLLVLLLPLAGLFAYRYSSVAPDGTIQSIAVLPFRNESGSPEVEYLSDGMTETLINTLAQLPQVKVISRNSTFEYKGKDVPTQDVAAALGVQAILLGRVTQHGEDLTVSVELVDVLDRTQLWGERYTRKTSDIQGMEEEIARTVAAKLRVRLSDPQEQQIAKHATENPDAYQLYLNGIFHSRKPGAEGLKKSLDYFNQALALDPSFAAAWVEVARVNRLLAGLSLVEPKDALARAKTATHKALELDDALAEAHAMMAAIKKDGWDWSGAEASYKRALELNPNLPDAHIRYSSYLSGMERHTEALLEARRGQELDPLRVSLRFHEASTLYLARRYDEAIRKMQEAIEFNPNHGTPHVGLGLMYQANGKYEQAIIEFQKAARILGETTSIQCYLGYAFAKSGKRSEAQATLEKLKTTKDYVSPTELAYLYVGLGETEGAFASLEKAYAAHDSQLQFLRIDPFFDPLRSDPRFAQLLKRVGL